MHTRIALMHGVFCDIFRFEDPWKQKVFCWITGGKFYVCPAGPDKKPINIGQKDEYDLLDWAVLPDKEGKFTLASDTTSSNDALKLKAENNHSGLEWIEAIRDAAREAVRKLEENRTKALELERKKVEDERKARLEAEKAAKEAAERRDEVARKSLDGQPEGNIEDNKRYQHAQKMVAKLTEEVSTQKERLKNLENRLAQMVEAPGGSPGGLTLEQLIELVGSRNEELQRTTQSAEMALDLEMENAGETMRAAVRASVCTRDTHRKHIHARRELLMACCRSLVLNKHHSKKMPAFLQQNCKWNWRMQTHGWLLEVLATQSWSRNSPCRCAQLASAGMLTI